MGCIFLFEITLLKSQEVGFLFSGFVNKNRCLMVITNALIILVFRILYCSLSGYDKTINHRRKN